MIKPHLKFLISRPLMMILKSVEVAAVSLGLVIGMYINVSGAPKIDQSIYPDSLTVGDKFLYVNTVSNFAGEQVTPVPLTDKLGEASVISDIEKIPESPEGTVSYACSLAVYKSGEFNIPSFTFSVTDSAGKATEISGDSLMVKIQSVLPADTSGLDIADIREPYRIRGPKWPYIVIPLGAAAIIFISYWAYRRFGRDQEIPEVPKRPPWETAFEKLDALKEKRHYDFGRVKQYYYELSLIIREYIEGRFDIKAVERTSYELEMDNRLTIVGEKFYDRSFSFFVRSDMAKFAKEKPSTADADSDLTFAYEFVRESIPMIRPEDSEQEKPIEVGS